MISLKSKRASMLQSGFTMIELTVGLAITVVTLGIIVGSIYQVLLRPGEAKDRAIVMQSLQSAGYWIGRDIMNSQFIDTSNPQQLRLTYTVQWPTDSSYQYAYTYDITYDCTGREIRRNEQLNTKKYSSSTGLLIQTTDSSHQTYVCGNVSDFQAEWVKVDGIVQLSVTASAGKYTETREYTFSPRIS